jgi:hypothetical protein
VAAVFAVGTVWVAIDLLSNVRHDATARVWLAIAVGMCAGPILLFAGRSALAKRSLRWGKQSGVLIAFFMVSAAYFRRASLSTEISVLAQAGILSCVLATAWGLARRQSHRG